MKKAKFSSRCFNLFINNFKAIFSIQKIIGITLCFISFFFLNLSLWIQNNFPNITFEQILYHLQWGQEGLLTADSSLINSAIEQILYYSIIGVLVIIFITLKKNIKYLYFFLFFIISFLILSHTIAFHHYIIGRFGSDYIARSYKPPLIAKYSNKKNLILIYVESLEKTYSEKKIFNKNYLEPLSMNSAYENSVPKFKQAYGTGWTIGGIVASQCGIPLKAFGLINANEIHKSKNHFLPNIKCLGDILKSNGYLNVFMGGADHLFAGKGIFFKEHGYDEIYGKKEWQKLGQTSMNAWGLNDDSLLDNAYKKAIQLAQSSRPFNLTILTVNTHHPNGFLAPSCKINQPQNFLHAVDCTVKLLSQFVKKIKNNSMLKNSQIIIVGDHLAMQNTIHSLMSKSQERLIYNHFYTTEKLKLHTEEINHFDLFPAILYITGTELKDGRGGLGYNPFLKSFSMKPTITIDELNRKLIQFSHYYCNFWNEKSC